MKVAAIQVTLGNDRRPRIGHELGAITSCSDVISYLKHDPPTLPLSSLRGIPLFKLLLVERSHTSITYSQPAKKPTPLY